MATRPFVTTPPSMAASTPGFHPTSFLSPPIMRQPEDARSAVVYCEGSFGDVDGKTANGLVRHSEAHDIVAVIDSRKVGQDAGLIVGDTANGIPICRDLTGMLANLGRVPSTFIYGMAPASGMLSAHERDVVLSAIGLGMNVVSGLHEFLSDDPDFVAASAASGVQLLDIRKPRAKRDLRTFTGQLSRVTCPRIAVLGTDCAIGKRTTATILTRVLAERGLKAIMIGTGQTGLMQGARYGVALDAVPAQFCAGELEALILEAFDRERPDVIVVEGQGALGHPAYGTSSLILRGSCPQGVVLQHAPARPHRCDFPNMSMPSPEAEIKMIEAFSDTRVIGLTINHENMTDDQVGTAISRYQRELGIPVTDALTRPSELLGDMVLSAFPGLGTLAAARRV